MSTSPRVPPELCDHIIDQLHDNPDALKTCSVVSKSWTARSQEHIFSTINFTGDPDIVTWQNAFPDPVNSPAHYTRTLTVNHRRGFLENYLPSFCNVTCLVLHVHPVGGSFISLAQLHGFTPCLKYLRMVFRELPLSDVLNLVYSFPLLDDLLLTGIPMASDAKVAPSITPRFSGILFLAIYREMRNMVNHMLSLPGGLHFRELILPWICDEDLPPMMDLMYACSRSLESLKVWNDSKQGNTRHSLDLSSAVNLKSIVFDCGMPIFDVDWITVAVESIKSPHIEKLILHVPGGLTCENIEAQLPGAVHTQWLDLDRALVKYLTSRSFRLKVMAPPGSAGDAFEALVERLLPNLVGKKMLEVVQIART